MKSLTSWCAQLTTCFLLTAAIATPATLAADADKKADPTGTWTWTQPARGGGEAREITMKIKKEGDKYLGTMTGRQGRENELKNVKVTGDELSFDSVREVQGNTITAKYKGKVAGDTIKGKITSERDGETNERDWTAKRKTDEKKEEKKEAAK